MSLNQSPPHDNSIHRTAATPTDKIRRAVAVGALLNRVRWSAEVGFLTVHPPYSSTLAARNCRRVEELLGRLRTLVRDIVNDAERDSLTAEADQAADEFRWSLESPERFDAFDEAVDAVLLDGQIGGSYVTNAAARAAACNDLMAQWIPRARSKLRKQICAAIAEADSTGTLSKALDLGFRVDQGLRPDDVVERVFQPSGIHHGHGTHITFTSKRACAFRRSGTAGHHRSLADRVQDVLVNRVPRSGESPPARTWFPMAVQLCRELGQTTGGSGPVINRDWRGRGPREAVGLLFKAINRHYDFAPAPAAPGPRARRKVDSPPDGWPTVAKAAEMKGCSEATIHNAIRDGEIAVVFVTSPRPTFYLDPGDVAKFVPKRAR